MSLGRQRAFSRHSTIRLDLPIWWSLRLVSSITRSPELSKKEGLQAEGLGGCFLSNSFKVLEELPFFCWALVVQASLAGGC